MNVHYPTLDEAATPEFALAVLQDTSRQLGILPRGVTSLSFDSTIAEWLECLLEDDWVDWRAFARFYNGALGIRWSAAEWREVVEEPGERRLGELCALIARHSSRPRIRPSLLLGRTCPAAGAFLTIRSLLHEAGANGTRIGPSTPLARYTRRYRETFLGPISRLAPGSLPPVCIRDSVVYVITERGFLAGLVCLLVGMFFGFSLLAIIGLVSVMSSLLLVRVGDRYCLPASVTFGDLRTFRDLAVIIAEGAHD